MSNPERWPEGFGPSEFAAALPVSRETLARLKVYVGVLTDWNARHNLVSQASLDEVWHRHIYDSAQLAAFVPAEAGTLADLGSGAGFPGLVLALLLEGRVRVTLFESIRKKAEFLEAAARHMKLDVDVRNERIERARGPFDVVTARACAPLRQLLEYAQVLAAPRTVCLFLKGQNVGAELTEVPKSWRMKVQQHPSLTHPSGVVLEVRDLVHAP
ncbi:MAG: 16S rRNA (guanine(527)-N(7))-methyltransferase RsmG [Alphaproteobacteria bacterium]|nr:16S rRNA (guanine(527)-N(7))-methyltransferase RsmG [Alphaproteobacteria bacterium]